MALKSEILKKAAENLGLHMIDIKISETDAGDMMGLPMTDLSVRGAINETIGRMVEEDIARNLPDGAMILAKGKRVTQEPDPNPIVFQHLEMTPEGPVVLDEKRRINVGDMVLMEYARDIVEHVVVEEIIEGIVYGLGEDGEPFCAPLGNCDKVPC